MMPPMPMGGMPPMGGPGMGMGPRPTAYDQFMHHSYDPMYASVPIPGISSGMLQSSMNYDYLPPWTPIYAPQAPPSPLQQFINMNPNKPDAGPFSIGHTVKISYMMSAETRMYNGMIGDIVAVETVNNMDGTQDLLFDVRCPLDNATPWYPNTVMDKDHGKVKPSSQAMQAAPNNYKLLGPQAPGIADEEPIPPPYILLRKLPTDKMQSMGGAPSQARNPQAPPAIVRPPMMGSPAFQAPMGWSPMGPPDMTNVMDRVPDSMYIMDAGLEVPVDKSLAFKQIGSQPMPGPYNTFG